MEAEELMARVENWPQPAQEQAVASLEAIEDEFLAPYALTDDDRQAIDRGLKAADEGRFATDTEVQTIFAKYRRG